MFENVLVGLDGRQGGRDALALAAQLIAPSGVLTLAHVHTGRLRPTRAVTPGMVEEEREGSEAMLQKEADAAAVKPQLLSIEAMSPGRALHQQAEQQGADLLVVGSCARGALGRAVLGDDTRAALNGSPCAIAIASLGYALHPRRLSKIGVGYDGSPESERALAAARKLAVTTGAQLRALEVVAVPAYAYMGYLSPTAMADIDAAVEQASSRLLQLDRVEATAVWGVTGEELASFGEQLDLLIVGSRGYGPMRRLVSGSTSDYLQRHARCCLLVLPRGAKHQRHEEGETAAPEEPRSR